MTVEYSVVLWMSKDNSELVQMAIYFTPCYKYISITLIRPSANRGERKRRIRGCLIIIIIEDITRGNDIIDILMYLSYLLSL